jgi:hypothetical protein
MTSRLGALVLVAVMAVWAGGVPVARASGWAVERSPNPAGATSSNLNAVSCATGSMCMAVGSWTNEDYPAYDAYPFSEQRDGRRWVIRAMPNPARAGKTILRGVSCPSWNACTAVGNIGVPHGPSPPLAERWDGVRWIVQRLPKLGVDLTGVSCPSASVCVAVGTTNSHVPFSPVLERWNGQTWSMQRTPTRPGGALFAVSCAAGNSCMAVGSVDVADSPTQLAEHWNGSRWSIDTVPVLPDAVVNAVSCPARNACIAVGAGITGFVERWNGSAWSFEQPPALFSAGGVGVSCWAVMGCLTVPAPTLRLSSTGWTAFPTPAGELAGVSCTSGRTCTAVGNSSTSTGLSFFALADRWE